LSKRPPSEAQLAVMKLRMAVYKTFPALDLVQAGIDMVQDPSLSGLNRCIKALRKLTR